MIIGIDFSLTSPGVVCLNHKGKVEDCFYITQVKKFIYNDDDVTTCGFIEDRKKPTKKDPTEEFVEQYKFRRNMALHQMILQHIDAYVHNSTYIALEGYAFSGKGKVFDIAESTGMLKEKLYKYGCSIRIHDPLSVKLWATGKGNANKYEMVTSARYSGFNPPEKLFAKGSEFKKTFAVGPEPGNILTHDLTGPGVDLCDAYHLAKMLYTELEVRAGRLSLEDLTQSQRDIFNRTTKAYPVNLLARPFIKKDEDA